MVIKWISLANDKNPLFGIKSICQNTHPFQYLCDSHCFFRVKAEGFRGQCGHTDIVSAPDYGNGDWLGHLPLKFEDAEVVEGPCETDPREYWSETFPVCRRPHTSWARIWLWIADERKWGRLHGWRRILILRVLGWKVPHETETYEFRVWAKGTKYTRNVRNLPQYLLTVSELTWPWIFTLFGSRMQIMLGQMLKFSEIIIARYTYWFK